MTNMEPRQINFPHQSRYPGAEFNCLYFSYCPRKSYQNPQICQTIAKIHGCSLQSNREGTIYRKKTNTLTELGDINILPTYNLTHTIKFLWYGKVFYRLRKEKCGNHHSQKPFGLQSVLPVNFDRALVTQSMCESQIMSD